MKKQRSPSFLEASITAAFIIGVIVFTIRLQPGVEGLFIPLILAVGVVGTLSIYLRQPWKNFLNGIFSGVDKVTIAALILLLVGALIGLWIQAGVIPSLIYYGLKIISPAFFLPATFLVCLTMSLVTGSSYGTIGTIGIALLGVQSGLGVPAPITAGAILSGAYFGDKMSPLSDTTNVAAAVGETDIFRHINSMMYTTIPGALVALALFWIAGGTSNPIRGGHLDPMLDGLDAGWMISPIHLIPLLAMLILAARKVPTLLLLFISVVIGVIWSVIFQRASIAGAFSAASTGYECETGIRLVDQVLSRGGMSSVQDVIILVLIAGALGGTLQSTGVLDSLVKGILRWVKRTGTLIASVLFACYVVILLTGNQFLSLVLVGQMFLPAFRKRNIASTVLTRSLEDSGTLSAPLIPWGAAGAFCSRMLGVPTVDYLPYAWFAFAVPVFSLIWGYAGIAVWKINPKEDRVSN